MAETSLKQLPSFSAEDEPQNTPGKGEKSKKREASSPLMVQDMQPEKKNRHGSGSSVSTESSASAFQDVAETDDTSSVPSVHVLSNPINPTDILQIASELRSLMLPEISAIIKQQIPDLKTIVCEAVQAATRPLQEEIQTLKTENDQLKKAYTDLEKRIVQIEADKDALEQYSRRNSLRISGIPEQSVEVTDEIVLKLVNDLGVTLNSSDIDRSHRVGRITDTRRKDRDIIVKFTSYNARQKLYRQRKELRDSESLSGVFINEDLTRIRSKLLFDARSLVRAKKLLASYSSDGKIFVLDEAIKRHVIGTHEELRKFGDPEGARQELAKAKRRSASFASARPCRQDQSV